MQRKLLLATVSAVAICAMAGAAYAATKTAQSVGVKLTGTGTFAISQTETWQYDTAAAATFFTNTLTSGPVVTCSPAANVARCGAANQPNPSAPLPDVNQVTHNGFGIVKDAKCDFLDGGSLPQKTYTQVVNTTGINGTGNWTFTWTYTVTPTGTVVPFTAWNLVSSEGSQAQVSFDAQIAGLSVIVSAAQPTGKYSFSIKNSDGTSRVQNLALRITKGLTTVAVYNPTNTVIQNTPGATPYVGPGNVDFTYTANGGIFGSAVNALMDSTNSTVFTPGPNIVPGDARSILNGRLNRGGFRDVFAGNNNGGSDGSALAVAMMETIDHTFTQTGDYQVTLNGIVKGNTASATTDQPFSITGLVTIVTPGCGGAP